MLAVYHPGYVVDLGPGHRFPMHKYGLVYERLRAEGSLAAAQVLQPHEAEVADLLLVHTADYVHRFLGGTMTATELRRLGLPWSPALARRARLAVHGTLLASRLALQQGIAANLAGGSHHAFAEHGEGFSVFNDIAVAIRVLQREHAIRRAAIIDLDVHQGNGTATIFAHDASVFTCSVHGEKNYPFHKVRSSLDIALPDDTEDTAYLEVLRIHVPRLLQQFQPDLVYYLAGVDPYVGDTLGRLALSLDGLRQRDHYVLSACAATGVPVVITMGGGYAPQIADIVEAHCNTIRTACRLHAHAAWESVVPRGQQ